MMYRPTDPTCSMPKYSVNASAVASAMNIQVLKQLKQLKIEACIECPITDGLFLTWQHGK